MGRNSSRTFGKSSLESDAASGGGKNNTNMIETTGTFAVGESGGRRSSRTLFESTNGMAQHRANAASRRAVIKMLGE